MSANNQTDDPEFQDEYRAIKKDVKSVIIINLIFLALIVVLYFVNQKTGVLNSLEKLF
jgi:hypothetical protein